MSLISNGLRLIFTCSLSLALPCIFHTSRHTYATMLLTLGADLFTVCKLLGHRSVRSTQIYAKIIDRKKDDAANRPDAIFINDTSSNT